VSKDDYIRLALKALAEGDIEKAKHHLRAALNTE
jgi:Tfp pilus assembly protein PilF